MAQNILYDTGYWFALYDKRDNYYKKYSLVDLIIRAMLLDVNLRIDALITFNSADFEDICWKKNIELLTN